MSDHTHKRFIRNYFLNPRMQLRLALYFVIMGFTIMSVMTFIFYNQVQNIESIIGSVSGMPLDLQVQVSQILSSLIKISLLFFLFFIIVSAVFGLLISHRIAGPMYAILSYIDELKNGHYSSRRKLRDYDELVPIMDSLHDLADRLEKKR